MGARIVPTRMALEIAHRFLKVSTPLDEMLRHPTYRPILENVARLHIKRLQKFDAQKARANDLDE